MPAEPPASKRPLTKGTPSRRKRFGTATVQALAKERYLWIRAGIDSEHKFTGVWSVVVDGRVFVRSWSMKPSGWYHSILADRRGAIRLGTKEVPVRAARVRGERLLQAINAAYAAKYTSPASIKYVKGFARGKRRTTTTELTPQ